jgi:hypothetical protein
LLVYLDPRASTQQHQALSKCQSSRRSPAFPRRCFSNQAIEEKKRSKREQDGSIVLSKIHSYQELKKHLHNFYNKQNSGETALERDGAPLLFFVKLT